VVLNVADEAGVPAVACLIAVLPIEDELGNVVLNKRGVYPSLLHQYIDAVGTGLPVVADQLGGGVAFDTRLHKAPLFQHVFCKDAAPL